MLKGSDLTTNTTKAEKYKTPYGQTEKWKECKILGKLLDTQYDIIRRKDLAASKACKKVERVFRNLSASQEMKLKVSNAYVETSFSTKTICGQSY